jgi:hypothetical protein
MRESMRPASCPAPPETPVLLGFLRYVA